MTITGVHIINKYPSFEYSISEVPKMEKFLGETRTYILAPVLSYWLAVVNNTF